MQTVAIISFPGEYGGDGAAGAAKAAEALGLEVVFDGTGQVTPPSADNPNPDQTAIISQIVQTNPDLVWATINPTTLAAIMGGAVSQGYTGLWSGNSPTYSFKLLATDLAPLLDQYYIASTYIVTWGTDVPGMAEVVDTMTAARPDLHGLGRVHPGLDGRPDHARHPRTGRRQRRHDPGRDRGRRQRGQRRLQRPRPVPDVERRAERLRRARVVHLRRRPRRTSTRSRSARAADRRGGTLLEGPYVSDIVADYDFTEPCFVSG